MGILHGKRGLIMGVANEKSAAWGIAAMAAARAICCIAAAGVHMRMRVALL